MTEKQKILENRLAFITCHREKRESMPGLELFYGKPSFFKNAFLFKVDNLGKVPANFQLHVPDWVEVDDMFLQENGWQYSASMLYMKFKNTGSSSPCHPELKIKKIDREEDLSGYCRTQSLGFNDLEPEEDDLFPILLESSRRNFNKGDHHFYQAFLSNKPAGVALAYVHQATLGIYSVTTLRAHRKQGISTSLLMRVIQDGFQQQAEAVTLQVMAGSYAESFYKKLGFTQLFECRIYIQPSFLLSK